MKNNTKSLLVMSVGVLIVFSGALVFDYRTANEINSQALPIAMMVCGGLMIIFGPLAVAVSDI